MPVDDTIDKMTACNFEIIGFKKEWIQNKTARPTSQQTSYHVHHRQSVFRPDVCGQNVLLSSERSCL